MIPEGWHGHPKICYLLCSSDWSAKDGQQLIPNLFLGKVLGAGMQGQIFELKDGNGRLAPIVLKVAKSAALIGDMEREWEAGQKIANLANEDGSLPGFMKVGCRLALGGNWTVLLFLCFAPLLKPQ